MKEEEVVHYYNVITGGIPCGLNPRQEPPPKFSVFQNEVSCPHCLNGKPPEAQPKKQNRS